MKESGTAHWLTPNTDAINDSKFTALPGGSRNSYGSFSNIGDDIRFWSSSEISLTEYASTWRLYNDDYIMNFDDYSDKKDGFYVRCIMD